jgi:hypothetical protein
MPKERDFLQSEITVAEFSIQQMFPKILHHKPQMFPMLLFILGVYQDIINEQHNKLDMTVYSESIPSGECSLRNI